MNVWVAPLEDIKAAKPVTRDTSRGIPWHGWVTGTSRLFYQQDKDGDENFLLYGVDPSTGEEISYTPFENTIVKIIASDKGHPGKLVIGINNRDPHWHDMYMLDAISGELMLVYENTNGIAEFTFDNDLTLRLLEKTTAEGGIDYFRCVDSSWEPFFQISPEDSLNASLFGFSKDNHRLYLLDSTGRDTSALFCMDLESGEKTLIASDDRADIEGILRNQMTLEPYAYEVTYDKKEYIAFDQEGKEIVDRLNKQFDSEVYVVSTTEDDQQWILVNIIPNKGAIYYLWDRSSNQFKRLLSARPELEKKTLALMTSEFIKSRDGLTLVSYLSLPPGTDNRFDGRPDNLLPMVLLVHGGPWGRDRFGYNGTAQWLANRGYAVLQVNFRGSTGFGKSFINAGDMQWGLSMHDDLLDAVDWAIDQKITSKEKVAIFGTSYGGYATLCGLSFTPDKFACGVDIVGPSNLFTLLNSIPPYWESFRTVFENRVGNPNTEEGRETLKAASPLFKVDSITKPLLIGQGANDPRVKQAESDQIVEAMNNKDIPVTYALFPDEGHGFIRPENRLAFFSIAEIFLARCLGGKIEPIGNDLTGSSIQVPAGAELINSLPENLDNT